MARGTPRTRIRCLLGSLLALALAAGAAGGWVAYQHSYDLREQRVTITGGAQPLDGVLARPEGGDGPFGLIVFVHGDGPADATRDTFYRPIWEALAKAGYASLSWNKPGVGGAPATGSTRAWTTGPPKPPPPSPGPGRSPGSTPAGSASGASARPAGCCPRWPTGCPGSGS